MAIELYSKDGCTFCEHTKNLLRDLGKPFIEYKLDQDYTKEILLSKFPEARTFPVVVVEGFYIGGYHELQNMINEELQDNRKVLMEDPNYNGA